MRTFCLFVFLSFLGFSQEKKHTVYFETDFSAVSDIEQNRLLSFLLSISEENISAVEVYGFCDDRGASSYNLILSQQRAEGIKKILLSNDVDQKKITNVDGKGELLFRTIKTVSAKRLRALNRKVELVVSLDKVEQEKKEVIKKGSSLLIENLLFLTGYSYLTPSSKKVLTWLLIK